MLNVRVQVCSPQIPRERAQAFAGLADKLFSHDTEGIKCVHLSSTTQQ